jgi:hypothetical protein
VGKVKQVDVTDAEREMMLGGNAALALGL